MIKNPYKVLIISCWGMLGFCFILKLFGADWFTAGTDNEAFIKVCNFIDERQWLEKIFICINCVVIGSLIILAELKQKFYNLTQIFVFVPSLIFLSIIGWYSSILNAITSFIVYLLPIIWLRKKWYKALIGIVLLNVFELLSILTKNVGGFYLNDIPFIISFILQIDTSIMALLFYLYSTRKEITNG